MTEENAHWYVVCTRPRWEKKVAAILDSKGIECYCPLNKVQKQWSDRKKVVLEPLFKGYVFIHITEAAKWDVKLVDGIVNYIYWLGKPAIVKEDDIVTLKKFLQEFENVQVVDRRLEVSRNVIVRQGVLMNYKGIVIEVNGSKARVKIESIGMELNAVFDKSNLEII